MHVNRMNVVAVEYNLVSQLYRIPPLALWSSVAGRTR
jgi:hypothetical protein